MDHSLMFYIFVYLFISITLTLIFDMDNLLPTLAFLIIVPLYGFGMYFAWEKTGFKV